MTGQHPRILPFGDSALIVVFGETVDLELNAKAHALSALLASGPERADGRFGAPVPGHASVLQPYDPLRLTQAAATEAVEAALGLPGDAPGQAAALVDVPVRYGGENGPDLDEVADRTGMTSERVIDLHAGTTYQVFMLGFVPGFAYLGMLPSELELPRRPEPRVRVPAGSVAITGRQTCIYPFATPGGWNIIGRTDLEFWRTDASPPARLKPGDHVRFVPVQDPAARATGQ